jgi:diguanylate cyclase (GGDEF)-like protein
MDRERLGITRSLPTTRLRRRFRIRRRARVLLDEPVLATTRSARLLGPSVRLGAIISALVFISVCLAPALSSRSTLVTSFTVPLWVLTAGFALSEKWVIHVPIGRSSHTLTLSELVFVVGLLFASPAEVVVAIVVGGGIGLSLDPLVPPVRKLFNLANYACSGAIAAVAFQLAHDVLHPVSGGTPQVQKASLGVASWAPALAAAVVMSAVSLIGIVAAMKATGASLNRRKAGSMFGTGLATSAVDASIGVLVALTLWQSPSAALLFVPMIAAVFLGAKSVINDQLQRERLETLQRLTETVLRAENVAAGLVELATELAPIFACESVKFAVGGEGIRSTLSAGQNIVEWSDSSGQRGLVVAADQRTVGGRPRAEHHELILQGRIVASGPFSDGEKVFAQAIANQLSMLVSQRDLSASLAATKVEAEIDPLTGIGNRRRLEEMFLATRDQKVGCTLVTIDLDGFKSLNDRFGHDMGDSALVAVAQSLQEHSEAGEIPVRLGGDEFAVLVIGDQHRSRAADLAERLRLDLSFSLADRLPAPIGASLGVASAEPGDGMRELLRRSDAAMYQAKRTGKGRVVVHGETRGENPGENNSGATVLKKAESVASGGHHSGIDLRDE